MGAGLLDAMVIPSFDKETGEEMVADLANNIIMPKYQYYELIIEQEINVLGYQEYLEYNNQDTNGITLLLFLALTELKKMEDKKLGTI